MGANDDLLDALVRHQVGLLRFADRIGRDVVSVLNATEREIAALVHRDLVTAGTPAALRKLNRLVEKIRKIRIGAWKDARKKYLGEIRELLRSEAESIEGAVRTTSPVVLGDMEKVVFAGLLSEPFRGRTIRGWLSNLREVDLDRITRQVRIGSVQGGDSRTTNRLLFGAARVRGRDGVTQTTRHQIGAFSTTAVNALANRVRTRFALANQKVLPREIFLAVLDNRTTPTCRSEHGGVWSTGEGPYPPLHFNCRSNRVPLFDKGIARLPLKRRVRRKLLSEYAVVAGIVPVDDRDDLPYGHKNEFDRFVQRRLRQELREPEVVEFETWFRRQPRSTQDDILGPARAKLWRAGEVELGKFVDRTGKLYTLAELAKRDREAFINAGLDPDDWR